MLFKTIRLFFAKRRLNKKYHKVNKVAAEMIKLREKTNETQVIFLAQLELIRTKYSIDNPKQFIKAK